MQELYRQIPKVDILQKNKDLSEIKEKLTIHEFNSLIKEYLEDLRENIKNKKIENFTFEDVIENIKKLYNTKKKSNLRKVINGTGVIIHTNLGRSLINSKIMSSIVDIVSGYNNLEYNIEKGARGNRNSHVEKILCDITGAEAALVVNNNAAAVILCLNEFAKGKKVIISRGELVEIGGSFRIPEIMELSGAKLCEVGTTNKTYIKDYEKAIDEETALILKVHTSNYKVIGFTNSVSNAELATLGTESIYTMEDLGSGVLIDFSKYGISKEPTVQESIKSGVDIVTISGDKLLGGPQCGIILGKREIIERLKYNPFLRAFRTDKVTLSILEHILKFYYDEREAIKEIPTLKMITEDKEEVERKAQKLQMKLREIGIETEIISTRAKIGGGSMPEETVASYALKFVGNPNELEEKFRRNFIPIIGRIESNTFILDMKTIFENDFQIIVDCAKEIRGKNE